MSNRVKLKSPEVAKGLSFLMALQATSYREAAIRVYRERIRQDEDLPWELRAKVIAAIDRQSPEWRQEVGRRLLEPRREAG